MNTVDLNCDMGEGCGTDAAIMPFISSANIACGFHAGDVSTMRNTLILARQYKVAVGAHPSYPDREHFGRKEWKAAPKQVYDWTLQQIKMLQQLADQEGTKLHHVKPHGALYNVAAKDAITAHAIAQAVKDADPQLMIYGLSGSILIREAQAAGLQTASEVFADRTYQEDGSLTPRSQSHALIETKEESIRQVLQMVLSGQVTSVTGVVVTLTAETICLHGDGEHALDFARTIHYTLKQNHIAIQAP
jgi:5-oxoprolinase (ATP-hydrolysing) subunit A